MVWLNGNRMRLVLVGIEVVIVLSSGSVKADFTFGTPTNLGPPVNTNRSDWSVCISADGLELYFASWREGGFGTGDIWVSTRETLYDECGVPENLGELVNSDAQEFNPTLSADGLELYFNTYPLRPGGLGGADLWVTRRTTKADPWRTAECLSPPVNSTNHESAPSISADGLELYFMREDPNLTGDDRVQVFYMTRRETTDAPWGEPVSLGPLVNSWPSMWECEISCDGLVLMWADYYDIEPRPGGYGGTDIWFSRRATRESEWTEPVNLGPLVNSLSDEGNPTISADGSMLYFRSDHCGLGSDDLWQAPILPVVDFDEDGSVGVSDLLLLIEAWKTDDPKCDIGPMPWGDGVVDAADLEVLMDHWGLPKNMGTDPAELIAHSTFDETQGMKAYDSTGVYDANLIGDPVWHPEGGMVGGALEFDGTGDYVSAPYIVPRTDEALSLFAWIKGGDRNQVIVSESGMYGYFLLQADSIAGNLMTSLHCGTDTNYLFSETPIIDGQWHHVGLVWDGYPGNRILYVDGVQVANDTVLNIPDFVSSVGGRGLNIGASWGLDTHRDFYWSGLIDDVRIYEGAINAEEIAAMMGDSDQDYSVCIVVDDFESYTDTEPNVIWETWSDFFVNNTGAVIGYADPPHAEVNIVHGGNQAMPYFYENDGIVLDGTEFETKGTQFYAEAQRQWKDPQDWTAKGVNTLTLWIHAEPGNPRLQGTPEPLYVALYDNAGNRADVAHPNAAVTTLESWQKWSIALADFTSVDLIAVTMMGIGVGDPASVKPGGSGMFSVDDIELHCSDG